MMYSCHSLPSIRIVFYWATPVIQIFNERLDLHSTTACQCTDKKYDSRVCISQLISFCKEKEIKAHFDKHYDSGLSYKFPPNLCK